jgi:hypothetical protein
VVQGVNSLNVCTFYFYKESGKEIGDKYLKCLEESAYGKRTFLPNITH